MMNMRRRRLLSLCLTLYLASGVRCSGSGRRRCEFPAIYNFGDSNSDTGAINAALSPVNPPNGETFFGHPSGRFCDGRLVVDFIGYSENAADALKLPFLSPYLDSIGTKFSHGANFATGGSSILPPGYSPFHLGVQILQFLRFKARTTMLYHQLNRTGNLPRPHEFSKALYTFDIGQNDLSHGFQYTTEEQVRALIPSLLDQFSEAIRQLYEEGARAFWVHNTGPIGCLPYSIIYDKSKPGNLDENNCVRSQNEVAQEFNRQLRDKLSELRTNLTGAALTYVDVYSAKYALIAQAKSEGFVNPLDFCCGSFYGYHINCGKKAVVNGTVYGIPCREPKKHVSWDGIHYSETANKWVAERILNGSFSQPDVPITEACYP